jgi:YD repeat-containing protein
VPVGELAVSPNTHALSVTQSLDFDLSPGTTVGGSPALVYNSSTLTGPIIDLVINTDPSEPAVGANLTLTMHGQDQDAYNTDVAVSVNSHASFTGDSGGRYNAAIQMLEYDPWAEVTGAYPYTLEAEISYANGVSASAEFSGLAPVVAGLYNPLGAGWGISGVDELVATCRGIIWVSGTGNYRYFQLPPRSDTSVVPPEGPITYISPPEDFGTLVQNGNDASGGGLPYQFTYVAKDKTTYQFWYYPLSNPDEPVFLLQSVTAPDGTARKYEYDIYGRLDRVDSPDGGVTNFIYYGPAPSRDEAFPGTAASIFEPGGRVVGLSMTQMGFAIDLTQIGDENGNERSLTYTGNLLTEDQWDPYQSTIAYTDMGLVSSVQVGPEGPWNVAPAPTQGQYGGMSLTDGLGNTTIYTVDPRGHKAGIETPDGARQVWSLNPAGQPASYTDQLGRVTGYIYNNAGDLIEQVNPDGGITDYVYEPVFHKVIETIQTVQNGNNTQTEVSYNTYNNVGELTSSTDADYFTTTYVWSGGLLMSVTDPLLRTTVYQYDGNRRQTVVIDPTGGRTVTGYDNNGNILTVSDPRGLVTTTNYDGRNQLVSETDAAGGTTLHQYDAAGLETDTWDADGVHTEYVYDAAGKLVQC